MVSKMADGDEEAPERKSQLDEDSDDEDENEEIQEEENLDGTEFDDPEGFVDDISDEELLGDLLKRKPRLLEGTESLIVVDNVPTVGPDRLEKLKNVIGKVFGKFGKIISEYYPDENGLTKGYIFLEYSNPKDAAQAVKTAHGYKLDKSHIFSVHHFSDFERFANLPEEWKAPEKQPFPEQGNLRDWLLDQDCNDQYSVVHGSGDNVKVSILLNSAAEPLLVKDRPNWTDTYVRWSPKGTYLATFHQQGVALWGGVEFKRLQRFSHPSVQLIDFSPCERYLVTFSPLPDDPDDPHGIVIWDIRTGSKKRGFHCGDTSQWPVFKWSHDGKYFARSADKNSISIFETPSFGLLDKKSVKVENIKEFAWSPGSNMISFWVPEHTDTPARVTIMEIPSRKEIRVKNLFNVSECKMYWQSKGDYLCVKVDRHTKSRKGLYYNLEVFCLREKQIPVDTVDVKETINAFAWEPGGSRLCIIHGESPRISASFYTVENSSVTVLKTLDKKQVNNIFWSPNGQFCVLAGLRNMSGVLEFYDTSDATLMNSVEHFMATDVEWDPTGRYVMSSVSWWAHKVDNGYNIWTFQGKPLQRHAMDQFCQLLWRPRPPTLLTEDDIKKIKKDIKKYQKMFEQKDRMSQSRASKELIEKRRKMMRDFEDYRKKKQDEYNSQKSLRLELRNGMDTDHLDSNADEFEEETIEFFIKEETIELEKDKE